MVQRFAIYEKAIESKQRRKTASIKEQVDFVAEIEERARAISPNKSAPEFEAELSAVLDEHYVRTHKLMYTTQAETIANSWRAHGAHTGRGRQWVAASGMCLQHIFA